jgi:hypothetical protein
VIIEGSTHGDASNLAAYLLAKRKGGTSSVIEITGSATQNLAEALADWELMARALTKGKNALYHTYIRLRDHERLLPQQWFETVDQLEKNLGLSGQPRAIVEHREGNRGTHLHIVWSRLRANETLAPMHHDRREFHAVARWAEEKFELAAVSSTPTKTRRVSNRDIKAVKGRGMAMDELRKTVVRAWNTTRSGEEFRLALMEDELLLLKGDRRDFVIDAEGYKMNPVRLLEGVTAAAFRERMKGTELSFDHPTAAPVRGAKARNLTRSQIDRHLANDEAGKPAKSGFTENLPNQPNSSDLFQNPEIF